MRPDVHQGPKCSPVCLGCTGFLLPTWGLGVPLEPVVLAGSLILPVAWVFT